MDFLNRAYAQLTDVFRSMSAGARLTAGLLLAAVLVSLLWLFRTGVAGPDAFLMGGQRFSANELPAMEAAFAKSNLSQYEIDGNQIRVPRGQQAAYMAALADAGALPANFGDYLMQAVQDGNPFLTSAQREEMIKAARQKELTEIIRHMPGIERAAVFFDVQAKSGLKRGEKLITASVIVKPQGMQPLEESRVPMIRHLVAGALAGLPPQKVTVIDQNGRTYPGDDGSSPAGMSGDDPYFGKQRQWQGWVESTVRQALAYVPDLTVSASVELEKELEHTQEMLKLDPQSVTLMSREESKTQNEQRASANAGRPGVAAQQANQAASLNGPPGANNSNEELTNSETQSTVGHTRTRIINAPLTPKRVTVAIGVPDSYYRKIWQSRNPSPDGEEAKQPDPADLAKIETEESGKIREHVARLVLAPELQQASTQVQVTTFAHLDPPEIPTLGLLDKMLAWLGNSWTTLGMLLLAAVSLLMLRSMLRSLPAPGATATTTLAGTNPPLSVTNGDDQPESPTAPRLRRRNLSGPSLRDELADIVREDPDAAANILRSWIGNAS